VFFYILLGLAARGHDFRDDCWPVPGGTISWARYVDPEDPEPPLESSPSEQPPPFDADPATDAYLDFAPQARRFMLAIAGPAAEADADETAWAVADALSGLLALASPAVGIEVRVAKISADVAVSRVVIRTDIEAGYNPVQPVEHAWSAQSHRIRPIMRSLPVVLAHGHGAVHGVFPAITYHRLSAFDYAFVPDDVRWVLENPDERPPTYYARARLEQSFHNAFKTVEALLGGEPGWSSAALCKRLTACGIDPDRKPHIPDGRGETVLERLLKLVDVRDKRSAHGGRTGGDRRLTFYDLVEMQWVAGEMITETIEAGVRRARVEPTKT
jgi:hypothetical protein